MKGSYLLCPQKHALKSSPSVNTSSPNRDFFHKKRRRSLAVWRSQPFFSFKTPKEMQAIIIFTLFFCTNLQPELLLGLWPPPKFTDKRAHSWCWRAPTLTSARFIFRLFSAPSGKETLPVVMQRLILKNRDPKTIQSWVCKLPRMT